MKIIPVCLILVLLLAAIPSANAEDLTTDQLKSLTNLAQQGDARAQYSLGSLYEQGNGVTQNSFEAAKWWAKAAEQGNADAQTDLGGMYANGEGVPQDFVKAREWFLREPLRRCGIL